MAKYRSWIVSLFVVLVCTGCAGVNRGCSSCAANQFGADWVVVKLDMEGRPYRCWILPSVSVSNEQQSDGIYWQSPDGHLVHVAGSYNRVQVKGNQWNRALAELGLTEDTCKEIQQYRYDPEVREYLLPGTKRVVKPVVEKAPEALTNGN